MKDGKTVIDLMHDPDDDFTECVHGVARGETCSDCEALTAKYRAWVQEEAGEQ